MDENEIEKIISDILRKTQDELEYSMFSGTSATASNVEPKQFNYDELLKLLAKYDTKNIVRAVIISEIYSPETGAYKKQGVDGIYFIVSPSVWKSAEPMFAVTTETGIWESLCGVPVYKDEQKAYDVIEHGYFKTDRERVYRECFKMFKDMGIDNPYIDNPYYGISGS